MVLQRARVVPSKLVSPVTILAAKLPANPHNSQPAHLVLDVCRSASTTTAFASQMEATRPDSLVNSIPIRAATNTAKVSQTALRMSRRD